MKTLLTEIGFPPKHLPPGRPYHKSVHGSTGSPRTDRGTLKINCLAFPPEHVEGRAANDDTASGERVSIGAIHLNIRSPSMEQSKGGGEPRYFLNNTKGFSVLFLVFAMLLIVTIGYVFSYLIPAKQKSIRFTIYSNQAFFIAQSGVEYSIRYGSDQGWRRTTDLLRLNNPGVNQRNLGNGRFTINYDNTTDTLTSIGEITGSSEKRVMKVSQMSQFLRLIFDPASAAPCWTLGTRRAHFYLKNVRNTDVVLTAFSASWTYTGPPRNISRIYFGPNEKFRGGYTSGSGVVNFNRPPGGPFTQTISAGATYEVEIRWNNDVTNGANIIITFYTATGEGYTFNLDPEGNGLPSC